MVEKRGQKYHRERLGEALREEIETIVEGDDAEADRTLDGLAAAVGFIRHEVAERLHLRRAPELFFQLDRSQKYEARINELLNRTKKRSK